MLCAMTTEAEEALAAATAETVWQLLGVANRSIPIVEFGISFDGVTATAEPVLVELVSQSTAGTATGATEVTIKGSGTPQVTGQHSFTAEPTLVNRLAGWEVHPAGGLFVVQFPLGREPTLEGATRIGLRCTAPAAVNCFSYVWWEEQ